MADNVSLHVIRRDELKTGRAYDRFHDPDRIAPMSPGALKTHLANPLASDDSEPVQILGTKGDLVIGRMDLLRGEILVEGAREPFFWGSNLFVPEQHRSTLMGVMLIMKSQSLGHAGAFGPSQQATPVYQKLKWIDLVLRRNILLRHSRAVMEKYLKPPVLGRAAAPLVDIGLAVHRAGVGAWRITQGRGGLRVRRADAMPAALDPLLARHDEPVQCHRSSRWINWLLDNRFSDDPRNRQGLYLLESNGSMVGYFLIKLRFYETATHRQFRNLLLGSIQDWMIFDAGTLSFPHLVSVAVRELGSLGADAVELNLPSEQCGRWLRLIGFLDVGPVHLLYKPAPRSALAKPEYSDWSKWWCRPGDGDNFFI